MTIKLIIEDEVNIKIDGLPVEARRALVSAFEYMLPYARYQPSFKLGRWNGKVSLFGIGGNGYISQLEKIIEILEKRNIQISEVVDNRHPHDLSFEPITEDYWTNQGKVWPKGHEREGQPIVLRDYQVEIINNFLMNPQSVAEVSTGAGKTITSATLAHIFEAKGKVVVIVPNTSLVEQTYEDFVNVGLDVGKYYGATKDLDKTHTICTWQSLNFFEKASKMPKEEQVTLQEFLQDVGAVIIDECHGAKGSVLQGLLTKSMRNTPIRVGFTGTIPKEAYENQIIFTSIGPIIGKLKASELQEKGVLANCHIHVVQTLEHREFKDYQSELKFLVTDKDRLEFIATEIKEIVNNGNTLVLVDRIEAGKMLVENLPGSVFISGEVKTKDRRSEYDQVNEREDALIVATYGVASTGINIVNLHNVVLIEPGKSFVRVIQSIGRGLRKSDTKDFVDIYDITSTCRFSKKHMAARKQFYKDASYQYSITKKDRTK